MKDWTTLGPLSDLENEVGKRYDVGEERLALFLVGGDVYAIGDLCSHAEASLAEGELFDMEVECPRHGSSFDVTTGVPKSLPATTPVPVYEVRIVDGVIQARSKDSA
ncbi:MAG: non-heme iron oxygenase ferredoxin subunit [Acidimicrobiia bacterium]|nr:non-heme iron oxygenase ferredoxin subunit [Acidimicrobiia bacterium]